MGKYSVQNIADLRRRINAEYLIRLRYPKEKKSQLVGFTRFCAIVGELHAEHYAKKALASLADVPTFKGQAGALKVVFFPR